MERSSDLVKTSLRLLISLFSLHRSLPRPPYPRVHIKRRGRRAAIRDGGEARPQTQHNERSLNNDRPACLSVSPCCCFLAADFSIRDPDPLQGIRLNNDNMLERKQNLHTLSALNNPNMV
ncbi:hypothetical protein XENOCAPTIV_030135 [Xenoophorus captivus]|uniref:Uncharacterized protein n=1 Tax=Xenoophorus captivus TaxID=1517983 RepID=A0ABV0Q6W3_9TELE